MTDPGPTVPREPQDPVCSGCSTRHVWPFFGDVRLPKGSVLRQGCPSFTTFVTSDTGHPGLLPVLPAHGAEPGAGDGLRDRFPGSPKPWSTGVRLGGRSWKTFEVEGKRSSWACRSDHPSVRVSKELGRTRAPGRPTPTADSLLGSRGSRPSVSLADQSS